VSLDEAVPGGADASYGAAPTGTSGPVADWATDFDHGDPAYNRDPFEIWAELRDRCPVAHTDRYNGAWLPVTHQDVFQVAHDAENYTSRAVLVSNAQVFAPAPIGAAPPITSERERKTSRQNKPKTKTAAAASTATATRKGRIQYTTTTTSTNTFQIKRLFSFSTTTTKTNIL